MKNPIEAILKQLPSLSSEQHVMILEVEEARLAALTLRPSTIWTYAIVDGPKAHPEWAQMWQQLVDKVTPADVDDLRRYGQAPGGRSVYALLETAVTQLATAAPAFVLPIGTLTAADQLPDLFNRLFPQAKILSPQPKLTFPPLLKREAFYAVIAALHPPKTPANYTIKIVTLKKGDSPELSVEHTLLFQKDQPPPSAWTSFVEKRLYRAINQPANTTPIQVEIYQAQQREPIHRTLITPPQNIFTLKTGFNYRTDQIYCDFLDMQGNKLTPSPQPAAPLSSELPPVTGKKTLDVAFIVDGTLRREHNGEVRPDLSEARQFLAHTLLELERDTSLDLQVALCLYGDSPQRAQADYFHKTWPLQKAELLRDLIQRHGTQVLETNDLDYEAALERALHWANPTHKELQWRDDAQKVLIVIGYAPPHPPISPNGEPFTYPPESKLFHEPFTSSINWQQELTQIQYNDIQVVPVWVTPPQLGRDHRCARWSYEVWYRLGDKQKQRPLEGLIEETVKKLVERATAILTTSQLIAQTPIYWPLTQQIHQLRVHITPMKED